MATDTPLQTRPARQIPEREIAIQLVIELAESGLQSFSLLGFYEGSSQKTENKAR